MIPLDFLSHSHKTVAVLGLGLTGMAACRALQASGVQYTAWDDNEAERNAAMAEGFHIHPLLAMHPATTQLLVLSPGIPHLWPAPHPVVSQARAWGIPVVSDIELFCLAGRHTPQLPATMIGVTGTNGKSTTVTLLGHMYNVLGVSAYVAGNIGTSVLSLPDWSESKEDVTPKADRAVVLELSSYQLELSPALRLDMAVLLNITPDHLARHGGMAGYIAAKQSILSNVTMGTQGEGQSGGRGAIGIDDAPCQIIYDSLSPMAKEHLIPFSVQRAVPGGVYVQNGALVDDAFASQLQVGWLESLPTLKGLHNWQNALAAYIVGRWQGFSAASILEAMASFRGLAHRQECVARTPQAVFINDSKGTNADAAARALTSYDNIFWIAGGQPKEGGIESLSPYFSKIRHAFLIGEAQNAFAKTLVYHAVPHTLCGTMERAVEAIFNRLLAEPAYGREFEGGAERSAPEYRTEMYPNVHENPSIEPTYKSAEEVGLCKKSNVLEQNLTDDTVTVLLSPACASWDQYKNFGARGDHFRSLVTQRLKNKTAAKDA